MGSQNLGYQIWFCTRLLDKGTQINSLAPGRYEYKKNI